MLSTLKFFFPTNNELPLYENSDSVNLVYRPNYCLSENFQFLVPIPRDCGVPELQGPSLNSSFSLADVDSDKGGEALRPSPANNLGQFDAFDNYIDGQERNTGVLRPRTAETPDKLEKRKQ